MHQAASKWVAILALEESFLQLRKMVVTVLTFDRVRFHVLAPLPGGLKTEGASESPFMAKEEASDTSAWHAQLLVQLSELLDLSLMEGTF